MVIEQPRIHESWLWLAEEHLKWGNYPRAKDLLKEVNLHARILKDQPNYARSLLSLSTIAYLEGESGSALKLDMLCHSYAQDIEFIEKSIVHTNDLLIEFCKFDDCRTLIDGSISMLQSLQDPASRTRSNQGKKSGSQTPLEQSNLPLEFALSTCFLLKASLLAREMQNKPNLTE